ncbi:dihydroxyacetone kinase subunit DhaK [Thermoactinomyces mirandus]|uniref:phosphoenolpyruvate--glycerone phosphotransferase n=1 Tax=Thermoactinomyces mirandus TaxID=2756294 RepID=A0A7W1XUY1_9BACL|nr:dihydroxyacetone kinase subunit DhaK [Thermoactinomyces mirandus]MBA4603749.1 dihydroxyacetone kinase subunit DhaK [Thermoactinomyces mirandus]
MKKLINHPEAVVDEMLDGMAAAHPDLLKRLPGSSVIVRKNAPVQGKVGLVSGGGSGHEPAHGGYVGSGMLDAAVAGEVFTSPAPDQILQAIKAADGGRGVLLIIKNYAGDVMNFDMTAELAEVEGIPVKRVIVNDDVALKNKQSGERRGIAGTVFVHKIAGAWAEAGASLEEVHRIAEKTVRHVRTMGVALTPCTVPAVGKPGFSLGENEMEVGMGIHGEPGIMRRSLMTSDEVAVDLLNHILEDLPVKEGDQVSVLVNSLGATPQMELYILNRKISKCLQDKGIHVFSTHIGEFMTSLEMAGCSLTLLRLDDELRKGLEAPANTAAWVQA